MIDQDSNANSIFFDLENPLHQEFFSILDYDLIWRNLIAKGLDPVQRVYVFLDEIQTMPRIPSIVKYLIDHYNVKFFLSGSASYYLKNVFSESLAGRKFLFELFPFSFSEFLSAKNKGPVPLLLESMDPITYGEYQTLYEEFVNYGGFPGVVFAGSSAEKEKKFQDIFSSYFQLEKKCCLILGKMTVYAL